MKAPSTAVSASARLKKKSRGRSELAERRDERARHPGDRRERDQEQVEPVDAELSSGCRARGSTCRRSRTGARRAGSKSTSIAIDVGEHDERAGERRPSARRRGGRKRAHEARRAAAGRARSTGGSSRAADQEVEGERRPRRSAAAARRRAGSRSGSRARTRCPRGRRRSRRRRSMPCTKSRLDHAPAEAAERARSGRTNTRVVELVEVPLVARGSRAAPRKRSTQPQRGARRGARRAT